MSKVHAPEEPEQSGAQKAEEAAESEPVELRPDERALAAMTAKTDPLEVECRSCKAKVGEICEGPADWQHLGGTHTVRAWAARELDAARAKVRSGEWDFLQACDHGSHKYCKPCMDPTFDAQKTIMAILTPYGALTKVYEIVDDARSGLITHEEACNAIAARFESGDW